MGRQSRLLLTCCLTALLTVGYAHAHPADPDETQLGIASYYSDRFQGATTASGDPFDQQALTAAHPTLPLGTTVVVTRPDTGKEVEVLINDRGPFIDGRIIDLSKRAARKLDMLHRGVARVEVTPIATPN
ncbi:septal ring lytic transglycosylase RlpA family protein [Halomonas salipaludis]|uniref:Endolytic peptidoglycan transglycosylase RlpA n=1 Tax=Halomonas salipaludis TaxID=2032625 RepID=A0A2A2EUK2_9GAMM|nr:septal ring lytic transglycosylase RlpA family protein [Halomonas salipaludis]PAU76144.1 septal ring lytic transglycosylase RlpA family lipoprotein [Halomonas salipaludis]